MVAVVEAVGKPVFVLGHSIDALCRLEAALLIAGISKPILLEPPIPGAAPVIPPGIPERMEALIDGGELKAAPLQLRR